MIPVPDDARAVAYSQKLLGLTEPCSINHCEQTEVSTGWLCYDKGLGWHLGFQCPQHGLDGRWKPEYQKLIEAVLQEQMHAGVYLNNLVQLLFEK
jgi:hypothetical protein